MGIGDSVNDAINKGKDFLEQNKDNIEGALKSEQAEGISDKVLDGLSDLAKKIEAEWNQQGGHKDPSDKKLDQCILHSDNKAPFKEIVAVLDALYGPKRDFKFPDGTTKKVPVFNMTFSVR